MLPRNKPTTMHERARNFCTYLGGVFDKYVEPEDTELPSRAKVISDTIKSYFDKQEDFKNFQFGYLGLICNNERTRPKIQKLREMEGDHEYRSSAIKEFREIIAQAKKVLENLEQAPDEDLDLIAVKVSLYINLFTKMYFE